MRQLFLIVITWGFYPAYFIDPFYGVVHYSMFNIIRPEQLVRWASIGPIFYWSQVSMVASWIINRNRLAPEDTPITPQMILLWVLALEMTLVTYTVAAYPKLSWGWTVGFMKTSVFCFLLVKTINRAKKLELYYAVSVLWFTLLSIWGIQQKLGGNSRMEGLGGVQLPDVNGLAAVVVMYLPMAYYSLYSRTKWVKVFIGIPSFIILVIFILFGGSRGAFLGLAVCGVGLFLRTKGKIKMIFTLLVVGSLFIAVMNALVPQSFWDSYKARLATMLGEQDEESGDVEYEGSSAGRLAMWKGAIEVYKNHPEYWLFGVGMYNYARIYIRHIDEIADVLTEEELPLVYRRGKGGKELHNTYLSVITGGGIVVFGTWMFLIVFSLIQAHNIPRKYPQIVDGVDIHNYARAVEVGILGYCVCITFINMEFVDFFYWFLVMPGIIANLGKAHLKREAFNPEDDELMEPAVRRPVYAHYT